MKPKLYLETTVPSYLTAWPSRDLIRAGHQQITKEWWQTRRDHFEIYISQFVLDETAGGDAQAARDRLDAIQEFPILDLTDDVHHLGQLVNQLLQLAYGSIEGKLLKRLLGRWIGRHSAYVARRFACPLGTMGLKRVQ